jgi:hypothetical protein
MTPTTADSPQMDWEFPVHEAAWTWEPESHGNPHDFLPMDDVIPLRSPPGEIKECPACHRVVRFSIGMCPLCGHDEEDWALPRVASEWSEWQEPNAMERLRAERSGPHPDIPCHNCGTPGGMIFDPLNEWARCNNCGARTPISGDMPYAQKHDVLNAQEFHEDPETGEPLSPAQAFQPASPDVAWPALDRLDFGPRRQGKTSIRNPFGDGARKDRRREKFDKSYDQHRQKQQGETLARDAEKTPPLLRSLWDAAYHHNTAPESLYLNHTYGPEGKSWYSPQPQARDFFPGWSNHLQDALKNLGPDWYSNWHQQYQQQKAQEHAANPDAMSHEHENWLDWYAQHAPEHFDPHTYDPATAAPRPTPPEAYYQIRDREQRQQEAVQSPVRSPQQTTPYKPDQSMIFNNPSLYSRTTTKEAGPADWANRFLRPEFKPQPENTQGLPGNCSFHPDRPAVAHEGFASMCIECLDRYRAAQQAVGHQ